MAAPALSSSQQLPKAMASAELAPPGPAGPAALGREVCACVPCTGTGTNPAAIWGRTSSWLCWELVSDTNGQGTHAYKGD